MLPFAEMAPGSKVGMEEEWILGKPLGDDKTARRDGPRFNEPGQTMLASEGHMGGAAHFWLSWSPPDCPSRSWTD